MSAPVSPGWYICFCDLYGQTKEFLEKLNNNTWQAADGKHPSGLVGGKIRGVYTTLALGFMFRFINILKWYFFFFYQILSNKLSDIQRGNVNP